MGKVSQRIVEANTPGKDNRGKKPDFKANPDTKNIKEAIIARSKKYKKY